MGGDGAEDPGPTPVHRLQVEPGADEPDASTPLGDEVLKKIIRLKLGQIAARVEENYKAPFSYDDAVVETVAGRCKEVESGARNVDHILTGTLLPDLAKEFLSRMAEGRHTTRVKVGVDSNGGFNYELM